MPSKRTGASADGDIHSFITDVVGDGYRKVEEDLGGGYVRLCTSEADRRQAAQDIRSSEDILLEMLRNARDAGARNIFIATQHVGDARSIVVIDDGDGIPPDMHKRIFQPRVTSKLDSAHLDRWGMHGRGMALFSIQENSERAEVACSLPEKGASILIETDTRKLPEKRDQSTFPHFEVVDGVHSMRGPRNILRTAAEFAIEHERELDVYCGSFTDIASAIWHHGIDTVPASQRAFHSGEESLSIVQTPSLCSDPEELAAETVKLGIPISKRSARRVMDGDIPAIPTVAERVRAESFGRRGRSSSADADALSSTENARISRVKVSKGDMDELEGELQAAFDELAQRYYLERSPIKLRQRSGRIIAEFEMVEMD